MHIGTSRTAARAVLNAAVVSPVRTNDGNCRGSRAGGKKLACPGSRHGNG
ncbi:hypothetical protein BN2537_4959 [Streptomyces venezuelae]|nr:hypothetical protein BN2537_4959 [Streptomyces venezuelae]